MNYLTREDQARIKGEQADGRVSAWNGMRKKFAPQPAPAVQPPTVGSVPYHQQGMATANDHLAAHVVAGGSHGDGVGKALNDLHTAHKKALAKAVPASNGPAFAPGE